MADGLTEEDRNTFWIGYEKRLLAVLGQGKVTPLSEKQRDKVLELAKAHAAAIEASLQNAIPETSVPFLAYCNNLTDYQRVEARLLIREQLPGYGRLAKEVEIPGDEFFGKAYAKAEATFWDLMEGHVNTLFVQGDLDGALPELRRQAEAESLKQAALETLDHLAREPEADKSRPLSEKAAAFIARFVGRYREHVAELSGGRDAPPMQERGGKELDQGR